MVLGELAIAPGGSARAELEHAGAVLRERIVFGEDASLDLTRLAAAATPLHPLAAGVALVVAARARGVALGLLADRRGRLALAHAGLADPLVIALEPGAPLVGVGGASNGYRWVCAHGLGGLAVRQPAAASVLPMPRGGILTPTAAIGILDSVARVCSIRLLAVYSNPALSSKRINV